VIQVAGAGPDPAVRGTASFVSGYQVVGEFCGWLVLAAQVQQVPGDRVGDEAA
jgi:hypothetical protein